MGELVKRTRKKGHPKKRYKDCIKETLKQYPLETWRQVLRIDLAGVWQLSRPAPSLRTSVGTKSQMPERVERHQQQHQMKQHSSAHTVPDCAFQEQDCTATPEHTEWIPQKWHLRIRWSTDDDLGLSKSTFLKSHFGHISVTTGQINVANF